MSLLAHQEALLALLGPALAPKAAYGVDQVPATRPSEYVEVLVSERFTAEDELLLDATTDVRSYRVTVWWLSRTSVRNALLLRDKTFNALRFARLSVGGTAFSPVQFEGVEQDVTPNDGWFVGSADFTY